MVNPLELAEAVEAVRARMASATPAVDAAALLRVVGSSDDGRAGRHLRTAEATVGTYLATSALVEAVPIDLLAQAVLAVAAQLWHAQDAPHGVANFPDDGAAPVRVARDPLTVARPFLGRFVGLGVG